MGAYMVLSTSFQILRENLFVGHHSIENGKKSCHCGN
jgi:hypothetical protein